MLCLRASTPFRLSLIFVLLVCALSRVPSASAQEGGSVVGTVVDPLGARVSGASVQLLRDDQVTAEVTSDEKGDFSFGAVAQGRYQLRATARGFQTRVTSAFFVSSARVSLEVPLPIGPLETAVTVTAAATEVMPSQIGDAVTVLDAKTLDALGKPDVLEALRLVPGTSLVQTGGRGGTTSLFVRGGNSNFSKLVVDGIPANDIGGGLDFASYSMAGVDRVEV